MPDGRRAGVIHVVAIDSYPVAPGSNEYVIGRGKDAAARPYTQTAY